MLKNGKKSLLTMLLILALAVPGIAVQASTVYKEINYGDTEGIVIKSVENGGEGDSFKTVREDDGSVAGKFEFTSSTAMKTASNGVYLSNVTGNVIIEQKLKFEPGENCSVNDLYYQLTVQGKKKQGGSLTNVNLADIYPSRIYSYISGNGVNAQPLSGANTFTPGKWYTVKIGIDTAKECFHMYVKGDSMTDWITVTPPEGYILRYSSTSDAADTSKVDFTQGVGNISYLMRGRANAAGAIYHNGFKVYTAPYIGSDVTPESTEATASEGVNGLFCNFEAYADGDVYKVDDSIIDNDKKTDDSFVWATGKTKTGKATVKSTVVQEENGKVLKITFDGAEANRENLVNHFNFGTLKGKTVLSSKIKFAADMTDKSGSIKYFMGTYDKSTYLSNNITKNRPLFYIKKSGVIGYYDSLGNEENCNKAFADDTWYDLAFVIDTDAKTWDCYRKESAADTWERILPKNKVYSLRSDDSQPDFAETGISYVGIKAQAGAAGNNVYLDDISFKAIDAAAWTAAVTPSNNAENVSAATSKVVIDFSESMNPLTLNTDNIKLYEGETEIAYDRKISNGNTRYEIPVSGLKFGKEYTVKISTGVTNIYGAAYPQEITSSFTTEIPSELTVIGITFEEAAATDAWTCGGVRARASMYKPEEGERITALYLVMYDSDGKVAAVKRATCSMQEKGAYGSSMVVTPYPTENKNDYSVYAYVWLRDNIMPLAVKQYK